MYMKSLRLVVFLALVGLAGCGGGGGGSAMILPLGSTITGTLTLPASVSGKCVGIGVDVDQDWTNGNFVSRRTLTASGDTIPYSVSGVSSGTHYLVALVDANGDSPYCGVNGIEIFPGSYAGYYGGVDVNPPASANADVPQPDGMSYDITLGTL
jgi:hypothetical protein